MSTANPNAGAADSVLMVVARAALAQGRYDEAERAFKRAIAYEPGNLEALEYLYSRALSRGAAVEARILLQSAAERHPDNASVQCSYAALLLKSGEQSAAQALFARLAKADAQAALPRLYLGVIAEQQGQQAAALHAYFRAITLSQMQGEWFDENSTPPELSELVRHAMRTVTRERASLFAALLAPLREQHGAAALSRVEAGLLMYLGEQATVTADPLQRPKFFYVPGLKDAAFAELSSLPWVAALEAQTDAIRGECLAAMQSGEGVQPFLQLKDASKQRDYLQLRDAGSAWDALFFYRHGERFAESHSRCPLTSAAVASLPLASIPGHAPEACFSLLKPGTHILPHHGVTNTRLVAHLPLVVPPDCALRVGRETHHWQEGRVVVFDDTYEHEAWNRSEQPRAVLICDVWHPELSTVERLAIRELVVGIGHFNDAAEAV